MTLPFIVCASVTAISAIISLGFSIAAALGATDTARTIALYACARSTALMIGSAVPFLTGSNGWHVEGNIGVGFISTSAAEKDGVQYVRIYPGKSAVRHRRYVRRVRVLARTWTRSFLYSHLAMLWSADNIQRLITFGSVNE